MTRLLALGTVVAALTLVGAADTARADHCSSYGRSGGSSFGFSSRSYRPSYYRPSYSSYGYGYSRPSSGVYYSRPGFSISIGSGRSRYGSYGYSRSRYGSSFGSHHRH